MDDKQDHISLDELTEQNADDDIVSRARAFEDYLRILNPKTGKRSADYIWTLYCQNKKEGIKVPTTNRKKLYDWKVADKWEERAARRDLETLNTDRKNYDQQRNRVYDALSMFGEEAVEVIVNVMRTGDNKIRLDAAKTLLSRFGVPELSPKGAADNNAQDAKPQSRVAAPSTDADEASLDSWLNLVTPGRN